MKIIHFLTVCICLALTFVSSASDSEESYCIALKNDSISYTAFLNYKVKCLGEDFETQKIITQILIPLPYHWGNRARSILNNELKALNMKMIGMIDGGYENDIIIYGKENYSEKIDHFCTAVKYNKKKIGMQNLETVFDVMISCGDGAIVKEVWQGIRQEELLNYMDGLGYKSSLNKEEFKKMALQGRFFYQAHEIELFSRK